ncbi:MAG: GNAT family N-acetyltransferase [Gammaproteobacteria bacterium]
MNISDYRIEPADYQADYDDLRFVRETVFVNEQHIPLDIEFDNLDRHCHHVVARDPQHRPIGTGRLTPAGNIGRIAVLSPWRMRGVGKALLNALIDMARRQGLTEVTLNAQAALSGFYRNFGFVEQGEEFMIADIPHQTMQLVLEPIEVTLRPAPKPRPSSIAAVEFETLAATRQAATELITLARRQLCWITRDLEHDLYGHDEIVEALKRFALRSHDGCARIILQDSTPVRSKPHPLLNLAQRLSSSFQFRMPVEPDDLQYPSAFLLNDRDGYLFRLHSERYSGVWSPNLPARNRQLSEEFERIWQRSRPCTEFRALGI